MSWLKREVKTTQVDQESDEERYNRALRKLQKEAVDIRTPGKKNDPKDGEA